MRVFSTASSTLASMIVAACALADPIDSAVSRLRARVESHLREHEATLKESLVHYGLVFPVEQADLIAYLRPIRFFSRGDDIVLGTEAALEPHAGGILRMIFDHWRPGSRTLGMGDRFRFEANGESLELGEMYRALRSQIFLPVPGMEAAAIAGRLPQTPQLPRGRMPLPLRDSRTRYVEADAWNALRLLIDREPDPARTWINGVGQRLSVDLLMRQVREHYATTRDSPREPPDHSNLHLVELLVAYDRLRGSHELETIKSRFLAQELARREFEPADEAELLAHYAESLGHLVSHPGVRWSAEEWHRVGVWLQWLEQDRFADLAGLELGELAHLLRGLRLIEAHRKGARAGSENSATP